MVLPRFVSPSVRGQCVIPIIDFIVCSGWGNNLGVNCCFWLLHITPCTCAEVFFSPEDFRIKADAHIFISWFLVVGILIIFGYRFWRYLWQQFSIFFVLQLLTAPKPSFLRNLVQSHCAASSPNTSGNCTWSHQRTIVGTPPCCHIPITSTVGASRGLAYVSVRYTSDHDRDHHMLNYMQHLCSSRFFPLNSSRGISGMLPVGWVFSTTVILALQHVLCWE